MAWSAMILLTTLQVDGVMRVFAQTRFLLALNLMRLAIVAGLIRWSLAEFHLLGAVLVISAGDARFQGSGADPDEETACDQRGTICFPGAAWRLAGRVAGVECGGSRPSNRRSMSPPLPLIMATGTGLCVHIRRSGLAFRFTE